MVVYAFTSAFYDPSPRHRRDDQGTPPHSLIARNRINASIVFVVVMSYLVYVIHALFVLAIRDRNVALLQQFYHRVFAQFRTQQRRGQIY